MKTPIRSYYSEAEKRLVHTYEIFYKFARYSEKVYSDYISASNYEAAINLFNKNHFDVILVGGYEENEN